MHLLFIVCVQLCEECNDIYSGVSMHNVIPVGGINWVWASIYQLCDISCSPWLPEPYDI